MEKIKVLAIVGSDMPPSSNLKLINYIKNEYKDLVEISILDYYDLAPYFMAITDKNIMEENLPRLNHINQAIEENDKIIIACPEYDRSPPARILNLLEWFSFKDNKIKSKPCLLLSASKGRHGGNRGLAILRQALESPYLGANVYPESIHIGKAFNIFTDDGSLADITYLSQLDKIINEFLELKT